MKGIELKKQLIEMIESIDDDELLYLLKEDFLFHAMSREKPLINVRISDTEEYLPADASTKKHEISIAGNGFADTSFY